MCKCVFVSVWLFLPACSPRGSARGRDTAVGQAPGGGHGLCTPSRAWPRPWLLPALPQAGRVRLVLLLCSRFWSTGAGPGHTVPLATNPHASAEAQFTRPLGAQATAGRAGRMGGHPGSGGWAMTHTGGLESTGEVLGDPACVTDAWLAPCPPHETGGSAAPLAAIKVRVPREGRPPLLGGTGTSEPPRAAFGPILMLSHSGQG